MKIKNRLTLYNLLITLISTLTLIIIFTFVFSTYRAEFYTIDNMIVNENSIAIKEYLDKMDIETIDYETLKLTFSKYGYNFYVLENNNFIFGNQELVSINLVRLIKNETLSGETKIFFTDRTTLVLKQIDNKKMFAIYEAENEEYLGAKRTQIQIFLIRFIILSIFVISFILLTATLFSNLMIQRIMKPVTLLVKGANRIKQNNYQEPIIYERKDEFKALVNNFNDMQKSLQTEKERNQKFEESKMTMINGISHDIRTPLTSVKGYLKGILDGVAKTKKKQVEYLNIAYNKTLDIEDLLNKLFETFNLETEIIDVKTEETNMKYFIDGYIEKHKDEFNHKNIKVDVNTPSVDLIVKFDCKQMERVLNNLLENSQKYVNNETLEIKVMMWRENGKIHLSYQDNGKGIDSEHLENVFKEFWREDESRNKNKGHGLGLYIVKNIVEAHDGEIIIRNRNGLMFEMIFKDVEKNDENTNS